MNQFTYCPFQSKDFPEKFDTTLEKSNVTVTTNLSRLSENNELLANAYSTPAGKLVSSAEPKSKAETYTQAL